jgi:hypothetical protein
MERAISGSCFQGVDPLAVLTLGGREGQSHFLADCAGQESAQGMRLPAGRFEQFRGAGSAGALQQVEDLSGFAAAPHRVDRVLRGCVRCVASLARGASLFRFPTRIRRLPRCRRPAFSALHGTHRCGGGGISLGLWKRLGSAPPSLAHHIACSRLTSSGALPVPGKSPVSIVIALHASAVRQK